jgi:hypothetical protein
MTVRSESPSPPVEPMRMKRAKGRKNSRRTDWESIHEEEGTTQQKHQPNDLTSDLLFEFERAIRFMKISFHRFYDGFYLRSFFIAKVSLSVPLFGYANVQQ